MYIYIQKKVKCFFGIRPLRETLDTDSVINYLNYLNYLYLTFPYPKGTFPTCGRLPTSNHPVIYLPSP